MNDTYWVRFSDRSDACVDADTKDAAIVIAAEHGAVTGVVVLPYPAEPRLTTGPCPPFCYSPAVCAGRTSCPKDYVCSE
jgi:hypothetical protein